MVVESVLVVPWLRMNATRVPFGTAPLSAKDSSPLVGLSPMLAGSLAVQPVMGVFAETKPGATVKLFASKLGFGIVAASAGHAENATAKISHGEDAGRDRPTRARDSRESTRCNVFMNDAGRVFSG